jgi:hypothetical protein
MDGEARPNVGYGRETGENMLCSRFTAHDPFRTSMAVVRPGKLTGTEEDESPAPDVFPVASLKCETAHTHCFSEPLILP